MNENQDNQNEPKLSDDQMDGLLSSFFDQEVPEQLKQLPSEWAEVRAAKPVSSGDADSRSNRTQRMIAGGVSLLAACLLLFVIANPFGSATDNGGQTVDVKNQNSESVIDEDATFNVSSGDQSQAVDDANTSLQEIDDIDLSPEGDDGAMEDE